MLACAVVAHCLVGVFNIFCWCSSCIGFGLLSSICSAFVGVLFVFEGAFEFVASISSNLISGGLWFSGLAGQTQKAKDNDYYDYSRSSSLQASGFVTADIDESLIKGSGEHGIVSSLPEGLGQASGRVDVPDDAKIAAAVAIKGTLRSGPGSLDALGSARSREGKILFFLKGHDGCTRVIKCHDGDLIHDVVGYVGWDIYATLHGHILDLSGTLQSQGVSDNDTIRVSCRLRGGSNNTDIPGQWQCANCDATRCWPVRRNCYRCGQHFCVHGETKSLSTCTRTGVRRPAVEKLASPQQVPLKLHEETWAGLLKNRGLRISRRWKSYRGVLSVWHVLHVLIILLSHLGRVE